MDEKLVKEEEIVRRITERFPSVSASVQRQRRIFAQVKREEFLAFLAFAYNELKFTSLSTVTGMDSGDEFQLVYHLSGENGVVLSARENAAKSDPVFETATNLFKGGMLYELEARNLLGIVVRGIPEDIAYPLPDGWPAGEYPLRKDWKASAKSGEQEPAGSTGKKDEGE